MPLSSYRAYRPRDYMTSILRGVWTPFLKDRPTRFGVGKRRHPFYGHQLAHATRNADWSILTNRWKLTALACVRNLGMMDPVYPKEKGRKEEWNGRMGREVRCLYRFLTARHTALVLTERVGARRVCLTFEPTVDNISDLSAIVEFRMFLAQPS
jgi:hypothetical protein